MADKSKGITTQATSALSGKTLAVGVKRGVKAESLHKALDEMLRLGGCLACGLIGFDISFQGVIDPAIEQFRNLEQIEGIRFADVRQNIVGR